MGPIGRIAGAMLVSPFVSQKVRVYVAKAGSDNLGALTNLIENGDVAPVIDAVYPFGEAAEALQRFGSGHGPGKIVLTTDNT